MHSPNSETLSNTVPLIFQWLPKYFSATVPNNKDYLYLQRLVDWAAREPQRKIYLVINGAGLKQEQITDLTTELNKVNNIHVVDFNKIALDKDIILPIVRESLEVIDDNTILPSGKEIITVYRKFDTKQRIIINDGVKLSELLDTYYNDNSELKGFYKNLMPFSVILDCMRLSILQNIEKITKTKEAIYLDFDILPEETGAQIGEVKISKGILMSDNSCSTKRKSSSAGLENSIIAINELSQPILDQMVFNFRVDIASGLSHEKHGKYFSLDDDWILSVMRRAIDSNISTENSDIMEQYYKDKNLDKALEYKMEQYKLYQFQDSGGRVKVTQDSSWRKSIDNTEMVSIDLTKLKSNTKTGAEELNSIKLQLEGSTVKGSTYSKVIKPYNKRNLSI